MPLKALSIKALSPSEKTFRRSDEKGLYIEVRPNGSKLSFLKYRVNGKEKRLGLGSYPDVSLADARKARDAARIEIQAGRDPLFDRKMAKIEKRIGAGRLVELLVVPVETRLCSATVYLTVPLKLAADRASLSQPYSRDIF